LPGHEFVFELFPPGTQTIDRVVLHNVPADDAHPPAKEFAVSVSMTADAESFEQVLRGTLQPGPGAQTFQIEPRRAKYVRLVILSSHGGKSNRVALGEFEVYSTDGHNAVSAYHADGSKTAAKLLRCSSALGGETESDWTAANLHDGRKAGADGSWCSAGPPPLVVADAEAIVDLTRRVDESGRLDWNVPAGDWTIMRFVCANTGLALKLPSPNSHGLAIDHFNPAATRFHFEYLLGRLHEELGDFGGTSLKQLYVCSYELSGST